MKASSGSGLCPILKIGWLNFFSQLFPAAISRALTPRSGASRYADFAAPRQLKAPRPAGLRPLVLAPAYALRATGGSAEVH